MQGSPIALSRDLDMRFNAITESMREGLSQLIGRVDAYRAAYQSLVGTTRADDPSSTELLHDARARLQKLELASAHVASSLAYLTGLATAPGEHDETREIAAMVLEGIEHERQRLYREVHDGPAQVLTNAIFEIEFFERIADRASAEIRAQLLNELSTLRAQLRESLEDVRGMIFDLRPPALATLGLAEAMRAYTAEFQSRFGLVVDTDLRSGPTGLDPDQELAIYRILQEALQNVHKHANARSVQLGWRREQGRWTLSIVDDGQGFDLVRATRRAKSFGLVTMRERAEVIGASFEVRSSPGTGCAVTLSVRERAA
ncbi:MAG: sensor histidine kinase [Chloroflexi bacterium]|nr:MAG: sensor histidine kinase [Chloroflexota bacterium]